MLWRSDRIGRATVSVIDVDVLSTDPSALADALKAERVVMARQVHGATVVRSDQVTERTEADAIVVADRGVAALVRVADCTPIALVDPDRPLAAVVHAGRAGLVAGVVPAAIETMRAAGARRLVAVVGPRVCGRCYELPPDLADSVAAAVPQARSTTSWGTRAADIGAGVVAQLESNGIEVHDVGADQCTVENEHWFSHRRQGAAAGRFGIAVVVA